MWANDRTLEDVVAGTLLIDLIPPRAPRSIFTAPESNRSTNLGRTRPRGSGKPR